MNYLEPVWRSMTLCCSSLDKAHLPRVNSVCLAPLAVIQRTPNRLHLVLLDALVGVAVLFFLVTAPRALAVTHNFELYGIHTSSDLSLAKSMGFNQVVLEQPALATEAASLGLSSTLANFWSVDTPWSHVEQFVHLAATLPAIVSANMMDEPMYNGELHYPLSYYIDLQAKIRSLAPQLKLSLTEYGPMLDWSPAKLDTYKGFLGIVDVMRLDAYPIAGKKQLRIVYDWLQLNRQMMRQINHEVPVTAILQAWNSGGNGPVELPTITQLRVMGYLAFFGGAETISFFDLNLNEWNKVPGFQLGLTELVAELKSLSLHYEDWIIESKMSPEGVLTAIATRGSLKETTVLDTKTSKCSIDNVTDFF